jgi:hypothetical protein
MEANAVPMTESRPCIRCAYDLKGLLSSGNCPECGTPVERSLRGDLIAYSDEAYQQQLLRGVTLIMAGILLSMISVFVAFALGALLRSGSSILVLISSLVASAISYYGYYLYSSPDPGQLSTNRGEQPRRILRIALVVAIVANLAQFGLTLLSPAVALPASPAAGFRGLSGLQLAASLAGGVAWLVQFFAVMLYTKWLAPRIPSERVFNRAKLLIWLGPLLGVLFFCVLAPLIALIMYYNMFSWIRKDLVAIRAGRVPPSAGAMEYKPAGGANAAPDGVSIERLT